MEKYKKSIDTTLKSNYIKYINLVRIGLSIYVFCCHQFCDVIRWLENDQLAKKINEENERLDIKSYIKYIM